MENLSPQLVAVFIATTGVGFLMMLSGVQKSLLEWRRRRRQCPSCGRLLDGPVCRTCTQS